MSSLKSSFDALGLSEKYSENAHEHELKIRLDLENIIQAARNNDKKRTISIEVIEHLQKSFTKLLKKFQASLSLSMTKKLRVNQRQQQQILNDQIKVASQLKKIKSRNLMNKIMKFDLISTREINNVDAFNYRLTVKLTNAFVIAHRQDMSNEEICRDVNRVVKEDLSFKDFFSRSHEECDQ